MATISVSRKEFDKNVKLSGEIGEKLMMAGLSYDTINENEIIFEVTANRPDFLSAQGIFRHLNAYYGKEKGLKKYSVKPSGNKLLVDKSLPKEWPYAVACIVKGIKFDDAKIKEVIDIQEKLGVTLMRKRKKGGIGVYPLNKIKFPVKLVGMELDKIKFKPLEFPTELTGRQILTRHPTGIEYAPIVEGWGKLPVFVDANGTIMSMPPIINSHEVGKVDFETSEVFIEATGPNLNTLKKAITIITTALADMGGKIYSIECVQQNGKKEVIPALESEKMKISLDNTNKLIGLNLTEKDLQELLPKMGYDYSKGTVSVPAWRTDILHEVDIIEDIAIAYGYDKLVPEIPKVSTIGEEIKIEKLKTKIGNILAGAGLLETASFHLNTKEEVKKIHYDYKDFLEVEDSKTEYNVLRIDLLTNLLKVFSSNSDSSYPQKIFETGTVFEKDKEDKTDTGILEKERLAIAIADEKTTFTEMKQILDYLFRMLDIEFKLEETENVDFIPGRTGKIIALGKEIGIIGEVAPRALKNWGINIPVVALELNIGSLV